LLLNKQKRVKMIPLFPVFLGGVAVMGTVFAVDRMLAPKKKEVETIVVPDDPKPEVIHTPPPAKVKKRKKEKVID
jgi:hypothetical protein